MLSRKRKELVHDKDLRDNILELIDNREMGIRLDDKSEEGWREIESIRKMDMVITASDYEQYILRKQFKINTELITSFIGK
jgi:hypothetical protein